jgi:RNase P/RNase MRP subunit p29
MFKDNQDFYPTPRKIIDKMLMGIDFNMIQSVLEPSAGKGNIVDEVKNKFKYAHSYSYNREAKWDIDTIEIDQNLQYILQGKNYRVVHDDFLTYNSYKKYDLIILNPPFNNGEKHLLKALEMQENGGKIVCLLNAETLKNPYNNIRKDLQRKLENYNADIEYIENAFVDAERQTYVEIALIKINIPKPENNSVILDELRKEEVFKIKTDYNSNSNIINADFIKGIIQQYSFEVKAGLKLITEYKTLEPLMLNTFKNDYGKTPILELSLHYKDYDGNCSLENSYIKQIRMKYWRALFTSDEFMGLFTSNLREKYYNRVNELRDYDFSEYNIYTIKIQINKEMIKAVEDTILNLFEEFSNKHHWYDEMSNNIHYYNGWKTNKAWKINKKVIIPLNGFNSWDSSRLDYDYKVKEKLSDIEKVFNYLDDGLTEEVNLHDTLKFAQGYGETKKIQLNYFMVTFYKKGTCHIEFTNEKLLHKFNLFGSQRKGWIPPTYGKTKYKDMTQEEKTVIDSFEGEQSYNRVIAERDYYIVETSKLLMLA